jgi:4,5-DOPA dioxygenase extradiol
MANSVMPLVFTAHGSPMNAIQDNAFTKSLKSLAATIQTPKAILVVSAHWLDTRVAVTASPAPQQIYDFYGFPKELYSITYKAPGDYALAKQIATLGKNMPVVLDNTRGIDHGTWSVLVHMYPEQSIPVLQLSINEDFSDSQQLECARFCSSLRKEGVLIIGSGNIVHNLQQITYDQDTKQVFDWAGDFDAYVKKALVEGNTQALVHFNPAIAQAAHLSVPFNDHYVPMLAIIGMREKNDSLRFFYEGFQHGSLSMRSFVLEQ